MRLPRNEYGRSTLVKVGILKIMTANEGLKLVASALAEDSSAVTGKEVGFSKDLYVNGVEYILRGLPGNVSYYQN